MYGLLLLLTHLSSSSILLLLHCSFFVTIHSCYLLIALFICAACDTLVNVSIASDCTESNTCTLLLCDMTGMDQSLTGLDW